MSAVWSVVWMVLGLLPGPAVDRSLPAPTAQKADEENRAQGLSVGGQLEQIRFQTALFDRSV